MTLSPEFALLDDLLGGPIRLVNTAVWHFGGDRSRMLRSLQHMRADGVVRIIENGHEVADWRISAWLRNLEDDAIRGEIERAVVDITEAGIHLVG